MNKVKVELFRPAGKELILQTVQVSVDDFLKTCESPLGVPTSGEALELKKKGVLKKVNIRGKTFYTADSPLKNYLILNGCMVVGFLIFEKKRYALVEIMPAAKEPVLITGNREKIKLEILMLDVFFQMENISDIPLKFQQVDFLFLPDDNFLFSEVIQFSTPACEKVKLEDIEKQEPVLKKQLEKSIKTPLLILERSFCLSLTPVKKLSERLSACAWMHVVGETIMDLSLPPLKERVKMEKEFSAEQKTYLAVKFFNLYEDWNA
mgnify:CR=1 FL=1